jgi:thiosulfate dehydrogenase
MFIGFVLGIVFSAAAAASAAYLTIMSGWVPANADAKPGWLEKYAAHNSLRATLSADAPKGPNPVAATDANLIEGIRLYGTHCAICHGSANGTSAESAIAKGEYPAPPQLASDGVEDDPQGWTFWKIKHGIRWTGMPSWKYELDDRQMWTLALFLKHMDKLPPAAEAAWKALPEPTPAAAQAPAAPTTAPSPPAGKG